MKQRLVDFSDPILSTVLFILLKDRTTGKNIIWATEPPPELGAGFANEITLEQIKKCPPVLRVLKRLDEQKQRTKAKAEVFTPSWVCEKMIDMGHSWMKCSHCLVAQQGQTATFSYCPNCGAEMSEDATYE